MDIPVKLIEKIKAAKYVTSEEVAALDRKEAMEKRQKIFACGNMPYRHANFAPAGSTSKPWLDKYFALCKSIRETSNAMYAFVGNRGNGKTQMSVSLARYYVEVCCGTSIHYCRAMDFFIDLKATYKPDSEIDERGVIEKYTRPDFLIIDEFQVRGGSDWENNMLTYLLDDRYFNAGKITILIGNINADAVVEQLGASIADRIAEAGGLVSFDWQSFRGEK